MKNIIFKDWRMILCVPLSNSSKAKSIFEKYKNRTKRNMTDGSGKIIACEFTFTMEEFPIGLRDYYTISNLKNSDYNISSNGIQYDKFSEGHHCYFIKYENPISQENLCENYTYGRKSLVGCSKIPIYEVIQEYASDYANRMLFERKEIFWFQAGSAKDNRWYIDKDFLLKIVDHTSKTLSCCPLFDKERIITEIKNLPDFIIMSGNKYFEFIPLHQEKISNNLEIDNNTLTKYNFGKNTNRITHIVKRKLPRHVKNVNINFSSIDSKNGAFINIDGNAEEYYEFDGRKINVDDFKLSDYLKY